MSITGRKLRHYRIRKNVTGVKDKPRLCVVRSSKNLMAQLIDDTASKTLLTVSTNSPEMKDKVKYGGNVKAAQSLGEAFAKKAQDLGVKSVVFDRAGYKYHGRVKALAEACRKGGLKF